MSYIYQTTQKISIEKLQELGYEPLPEEICKVKDQKVIWFKIVKQPKDGECVKTLINFYNYLAEKICSNKYARKAHAQMGIKFRKKKGAYYLVVNEDLKEMFSVWRIEINLEDDSANIYFTISDGNLPSFYDAEEVLEKYCKEEIELLVVNGLAEKIEVPAVETKQVQ